MNEEFELINEKIDKLSSDINEIKWALYFIVFSLVFILARIW